MSWVDDLVKALQVVSFLVFGMAMAILGLLATLTAFMWYHGHTVWYMFLLMGLSLCVAAFFGWIFWDLIRD